MKTCEGGLGLDLLHGRLQSRAVQVDVLRDELGGGVVAQPADEHMGSAGHSLNAHRSARCLGLCAARRLAGAVRSHVGSPTATGLRLARRYRVPRGTLLTRGLAGTTHRLGMPRSLTVRTIRIIVDIGLVMTLGRFSVVARYLSVLSLVKLVTHQILNFRRVTCDGKHHRVKFRVNTLEVNDVLVSRGGRVCGNQTFRTHVG